MAITSAVCDSFKAEQLGGSTVHDFSTDTFKMALYTDSATLGATTTAYTVSNEVSGTGYSAGGVALTSVSVTAASGGAYLDFADPSWTSATFTARGCLVYNSSKSNRAVFVLDFGSNKTVSSGTFTVILPTASLSDAVLRIT